MAETTSIGFPNMFDVSRNCLSIISDSTSVINRSRLLILTEPTELYNNPDFGVGLKKYLWMYNQENTAAIVKDRIVEQLRKYEPCVDAEHTQFAPQTSPRSPDENDYNTLGMTVVLKTTFGSTETLTLKDSFDYSLVEQS